MSCIFGAPGGGNCKLQSVNRICHPPPSAIYLNQTRCDFTFALGEQILLLNLKLLDLSDRGEIGRTGLVLFDRDVHGLNRGIDRRLLMGGAFLTLQECHQTVFDILIG